jgi:hypothetical protein
MENAAALRFITFIEPRSSHRLLGALGMLCGPLLLVLTVLSKGGYVADLSRGDGLISAFYIAGWMCTAAGLRRLRVTGRTNLGTTISNIQMVLLILAMVWSVLIVLRPEGANDNVVFQITDLAWPLSHAYMILVGVAAMTTGVWTGWRRYVPLLCGFSVAMALLADVIGGRDLMAITFSTYIAITWPLLGYAVMTARTNEMR